MQEKKDDEYLRKSRAGLSTEIHCLINEKGQPIDFRLTGGQVHDSKCAEKLLEGKRSKYILADTAYSNFAFRGKIKSLGAKAIIPNHPRHKVKIPLDRERYKQRNIIERFFNKLKHFRAIATRYIKCGSYFLQAIFFASFIIGSRSDDTS